MRLGELLVGQGLVTPEQIAAAVQRQQREGGRLGMHLVAMGALTVDKLLIALRSQKSTASTLSICEQTLKSWQVLHGAFHPKTHRARYSYARALLAAGRPEEALKEAEAALAGHRKTVGEHHAWTDDALQLVADTRHAAAKRETTSSAPASGG
ncbi:MAG TPA: tetratricopeptide repeat protein [Stellaceae bacterium]|nr:tetratricopeptide repeat protein [Stellaceae bacterium]